MNRPLLLSHLLEVLEETEVSGGKQPASSVLDKYYRSRSYLGRRDRSYLSDLFWYIIRRSYGLDGIAEQYLPSYPKNCSRIYLALVALGEEIPALREEDGLYGIFRDRPVIPDLDERLQDSSIHFPPAFIEKLDSYLAREERDLVLDSLLQEKDVHFRVNTLKVSMTDLPADLREMAPGRVSPVALRLKQRFSARSLKSYLNGTVELQDESSQLIALLTGVKGGELVVDAAAGAGGKTLHLAAMMGNTGKLIASDISMDRLKRLKARAYRANAKNIVYAGSAELEKRFKDRADVVLLDAPCSGSGTVSRNPDLTGRLHGSGRVFYTGIQSELLTKSAGLVKPGGLLVYATCSLFPEENQDRVKEFLDNNRQFSALSCVDRLSEQGVAVKDRLSPFLLILPYDYESDGFFAACLKREA